MIYADISYSKTLAHLFKDSDWWWVRTPYQNYTDEPEYFLNNTYGTDKQERELVDAYPAITTDMAIERLPKGYMVLKTRKGYVCEDLDTFIEPTYNSVCSVLECLDKEEILK